MRTHKLFYFTIYKFLCESLFLLMSSFLIACDGHKNQKQILSTENKIQISEAAININTASAEELEKLPRIGSQKARAIVEYRAKFGKFQKSAHLLLVRGISDRQFREIENLIKTE